MAASGTHWWRMLTIGKLASGPTAGRYYVRQVAQGREDYYAGEGEAPGAWVGSGAKSLALSGEVTEGGIGRLLDARDPCGGEPLRRPLASGAVAGFDLTFRAPKSVSVLFAIGEPDLVGEIVRAHEAAVAEALDYMERAACRARRGRGGAVVVEGRGSSRRRFGTAPRARAIRCFTRTWWSRTRRRAQTGGGRHSMAGCSTGIRRPPATCIRRCCGRS